MSDLAKNLESMILKAGIDGALTEEAVAQFNALVKQRDALDVDNKRLDDANTELTERISDVSERYNKMSTKAQEWATREQELKDREEKCTRLECEKEMHEMRVADHKSMFETVFKGIHVRKQVVTPGSATVDQYGTRQSEFPDTTPVTEEE
jgi:uncharacterized protein (DUF3084 family)